MNLIIGIITGILSGFIAGRIIGSDNKGWLANLFIGLIGGFIGGWVFGLLNITWGGWIGTVGTSVVGAVILLLICNKLMK